MMEGLCHVMPVTGLKSPNTEKDDGKDGGNHGLRDFLKLDGLCSVVDKRFHPGNIYRASSAESK
jgi:hypothetical protein